MVQSGQFAGPRTRPIIPDNPNWRRHKNACAYYRERWFFDDERSEDGQILLYQSICLQNTPPVTQEEQDKCMQPRRTCWRIQEAARASRRQRKAEVETPVATP